MLEEKPTQEDGKKLPEIGGIEVKCHQGKALLQEGMSDLWVKI